MTHLDLPVRLRRLRKNQTTRHVFEETSVALKHLIQPYFIVNAMRHRKETPAHSGLIQISADMIIEDITPLVEQGVGGVMLFGVPDEKCDDGRLLHTQTQALRQAIGIIKKRFPECLVFSDVCLCSYTSHGHCGFVVHDQIDNDSTVKVLAEMAVMLAESGSDFVCPSDMMDGRIRAIRQALDSAKLTQTAILSYAAKMASAFYGPFRHAAHSAPQWGDRKSYQMPVSNRREALREILSDEAEGADALLIKPALTNLDLIRDARERVLLPLVAYQVSGEYMMLKQAMIAQAFDFDRAMHECLLSIRRAGADLIVSYYARELAELYA